MIRVQLIQIRHCKQISIFSLKRRFYLPLLNRNSTELARKYLILNIIKCYYDDHINKDEMGEACSSPAHGTDGNV
jgi:hypothetical protein